ncbi:MAG TPA: hypothetical protein VF363_06570 [Candidatus Eisenbacteria bacterium]
MDSATSRRCRRETGTLLVSVLAFFSFAASGCGGGAKTNAPVKPVPLTVTAMGVGGAVQRFAAPALVAGVAATDTIPVTFTQALLVVRDVRFVLPDELSGDDADMLGTGEGDDDSLGVGESDSTGVGESEDGGGQIRFHGPYVIDLLSGTAQKLDTQMVPPGDYVRVQGHLQPLHSGDEPASDHPDLVGYTVWLEGDIAGDGGGHFVYKTPINDEFLIGGRFTVAQDTPATAFVTFDLSRFLTDRSGHFLDPRIGDNDQAIRQAIRHAIKAGMDENHDGAMDDDMHAEGD